MVTISELQDAIDAIQQELGVNPGGVYADTRVRLDILEARINNPLVPAPNVENPFFIGNDGISISTGLGAPTEDRLDGSLYLRQDGNINEGLYARRSGAWSQIDTDAWVAAGDLSGAYNNQTVVGLQNRPLSSDMPLDGYHITWNDFNAIWEPQIGFYADNDLSGTKISQTVIGLQGRPLDSTLPNDGEVLTWNDVNNQWQPQTNAVIFDTIGDKTNIKANRSVDTSIIDNTKSGIVNFGSNSTATSDYVTISGGVGHSCDAHHSSIVGGYNNTIIFTPSPVPMFESNHSILGGYQNTINSPAASIILGGFFNNIETIGCIITGGVFNSITGNNGGLSSIINGITNVIDSTLDSTFGSLIGSGENNYIYSSELSVILAGAQNTIQNSSSSSSILEGSQNSIADCMSSSIVNGDANSLISVNFSSILNGSNNQIQSSFSTILNGDANQLGVNSDYSTILGGTDNQISDSNHSIINGSDNNISDNSGFSVLLGGNNTVNLSNYSLIFGNFNQLSNGSYSNTILNGFNNQLSFSINSLLVGDSNYSSDAEFSNVFGSNNSIGFSTNSHIVGNGNSVLSGYDVSIHGNNSLLAGAGSSIFGSNNFSNGDYSHTLGHDNYCGDFFNSVNYALVHGHNGYARHPGQYVQSVGTLSTNLGHSQYSRVIVDGSSTAGAAIPLTCFGNNLQFEDGKSYDITVRVLVVNTNGIPTCARYVYDILAHQETGTLTIDNFNNTLSNDNGTGWTVTINASADLLNINVDVFGTMDRRAVATVEWRELSRA